jgi:putative NADH-flavin reductase
MTRILIIGASGATGQALLAQSLDAGYAVTALTRDRTKMTLSHDRLQIIVGDVLDTTVVDQAVAGQDAVLVLLSQPNLTSPSTLSSVGTQHIVQAMERHGVKRLISVTMLGLGTSRQNAPFLYNRVFVPLLLKHVIVDKQRQEEVIQASALDWTIVRPPRLTDDPAGTPYQVIVDGAGKVSKMPRGDLAQFMFGQIADAQYVRQAVVVGA